MPRLRTHPGEVLREEYLAPLGLSARALAKALGVPANRLTEIMRGTRDVSAIPRSGSGVISAPTRGSG
jgi:addiction module HigA family antidote